MHILLTDLLTCPRCGPGFGLVVLAERLEDRRVREGRLGCANCRESYPIEEGVADLRYPPGAAPAAVEARNPEGEEALRLAALLGGGEAAGTVLLLGVPGGTAAGVARLLPGTQVAASAGEGEARDDGVSRARIGVRIPFRDRSLRGVALGAGADPTLLEEAVRTLAPGARLVWDPAPPGAAAELAGQGLGVLLEQDGVVVASLSPAG